MNRKLKSKFLDLRPGTRIVSNTFPIGNWVPDKEASSGENSKWNTAFMWVVPAKVEGTWKPGNDNLRIRQKYQFFKISLVQKPRYLKLLMVGLTAVN